MAMNQVNPTSGMGGGGGPSRPSIISVTDDVTPITGTLTSGGSTNDSDLTVRVSITDTNAVVGDTVQLYRGGGTGTQLGTSYTLTATDLANGYADVATGTLTDGTYYTITARITDQGGQQSNASSDNFSITVDTTAPVAPVISGISPHTTGNGAATDTATVTVSGTAEAGSTLTLNDGARLIGAVTVPSTGYWSFSATLDMGVNELSAVSTDAAGNASSATSFTATLYPPACFVQGTCIAVPSGEAAVETLKIGDLVLTGDGVARPIKWIGRRSYTAAQVTANRHLRKVIVSRDAIAPGMPHRDLAVSPMHALYVDDRLIPAAALVNGASIRRDDTCVALTYLHIELEQHEIVFSEGLPSETFVDDGTHLFFDNADEYYQLFGSAPASGRCIGWRVEEGEDLEAIRRRLAMRAGCRPGVATAGPIQGHIERIGGGAVEGWVVDTIDPTAPVKLELLISGRCEAVFVANRYRMDLDYHGIGDGVGGFLIPLPGGSALAEDIEIRRVADRAAIPSQAPMSPTLTKQRAWSAGRSTDTVAR